MYNISKNMEYKDFVVDLKRGCFSKHFISKFSTFFWETIFIGMFNRSDLTKVWFILRFRLAEMEIH